MFNDLIERCIRHEEKAWGEFIERFSGLLYYSARERLKRSSFPFRYQDIEDIVQVVFMEIWEKSLLEKVREREKIGTWLSIMAQTRALNYIRKKRERLLSYEESYKSDNIKVDRGAQLNEDMIERIESIVEDFDVRDKIVLKLSIIYGKTHREIAGFMNIPINTVSTIIARKKRIIREELKDF